MPAPRKRAAFTLIELILVIIIIGVLAAIIVPRFVSQVAKSEEAAAQANLSSIRSALDVVVARSKGVYPTAADLPGKLKNKDLGALDPIPKNSLLGLAGADGTFKNMTAKPGSDADADESTDWLYWAGLPTTNGGVWINKKGFVTKW